MDDPSVGEFSESSEKLNEELSDRVVRRRLRGEMLPKVATGHELASQEGEIAGGRGHRAVVDDAHYPRRAETSERRDFTLEPSGLVFVNDEFDHVAVATAAPYPALATPTSIADRLKFIERAEFGINLLG